MSGGGGSGSSSTTVQKADPWSGVQPGLTNLYNNAGSLFATGGPQVYQGSSVAPITSGQQQGMNGLNNIADGYYGALNPSQVQALNTTSGIVNGTDAQSQYLNGMLQGNGPSADALKSIMNGTNGATQALTQQMNGKTNPEQALMAMLSPDYLNVNNNASLQAAMNAANQNTTRNFNTAVMPGLASQFSAAGRFGSGAQSQGISDATNNLATQISGTNAGMASSAWSQLVNNQLGAATSLGGQMGNAATSLGGLQSGAATALGNQQINAGNLLNSRQMSGLQMLPSMALQGVTNAQAGITAGNMQQQQDQAQLTDLINRFNMNQQQPYNNLNWYSNILNGGMTLNGSSSTQTGGGASSLQSGLGGALGGAAIGGQLGGGYGAAIGGIGGGLLGLL